MAGSVHFTPGFLLVFRSVWLTVTIMKHDATLRCRCGELEGTVKDVSPASVNRVICYCDDCQAYLHHLGRSDLLDAHGGTDIVQVAPAALSIHRGAERIAGLRLTPKGVYRFHSSCCNTPLGNTVGTAIPFLGIAAQGFAGSSATLDKCFGEPMGKIHGKYAVGNPPEGSTKPNLRLLFRAFSLVLRWRLSGKAWPHPFFDRSTGAPRYPVTTLSPLEREALRAKCGPRPSAR